jgi:hypothetical protein
MKSVFILRRKISLPYKKNVKKRSKVRVKTGFNQNQYQNKIVKFPVPDIYVNELKTNR